MCLQRLELNNLYIITARKRSLGQGNVFTPVCHSVRGEGCIPACSGQGCVYYSMQWAGVVYPSMHWGRGCLPRGRVVDTPQADPPSTETATEAGGTHSPGLHSCLESCL